MTEKEWRNTTDWIALWHALKRDEAGDRRRRIIATALCRRLSSHISDPRLLRLIELSEARTDGRPLNEDEWDMWEDACDEAVIAAEDCQSAVENAAAWVVVGLRNDDHKIGRSVEGVPYYFGCVAAIDMGILQRESSVADGQRQRESTAFAAGRDQDGPKVISELIRDVEGNPFRPVSFSSEWRTSTVVSIAKSMYDSRDFGPMPLLADALQDAGCEHADILDHCRGTGPHVRGCWVVDLVLEKA